MSTPKHEVLVADDGSPDAELALGWGIECAERTGARLKVVVVTELPDRQSESVRHQAERWAQTIVARARAELTEVSVPVEVVLERGGTLPVLLHSATEASILVVGSHGHSLWNTGWLGSTSQHLAGHADCTVAVVRPPHNPRSRRILVGIDGSPASRRALQFAVDRAKGTGEEVLAVHAYQHLSFAEGGRTGALALDIDTQAVDEAERLAAALVAGFAVDEPGVDVRSTAVIGGAGRAISRLSDQASLVVVGSRGRTPVQELVLGSVSQEVLHKAECPVVVVR